MLLKINGYPISTRFGEIDEVHKVPHNGIDFAIPFGTPVEAVGSGTVTSLTDEGSLSFGKAVHLHLDNGTDVIYGHLSAFNVRVGQRVDEGEIVGLVGSTGRSTGPHLHLQAMQNGHIIDPSPLIQQKSNSLIDKLNPIKGLQDQVAELNHKIDNFIYWINPVHWVQHGWIALETFINSGGADYFIMAVVIGGIMLWMVGMNSHKKYVFWMFIGYLALRGVFS